MPPESAPMGSAGTGLGRAWGEAAVQLQPRACGSALSFGLEASQGLGLGLLPPPI